ncbi:hypothetical protein BN7_1675 [Wickerhamomyces ciferrii]|uniref:Copper-fist domain-containing protein n=1 Tax=Wickerhamomyces ciferrii (strain ATCC 14091 / BCRC 22168 / CBS 111 / JCM 3599 / NBRC 0793 / NRRL Y-1031 F-60-10) TaxID=1206466 RepID=K0KGM4_WICCF|nr:uncharacterized protein BN7_1675 [Wickerhamomyces ciferrii]CCH42131.1 hypothetical protein BN7_1675 [Wickerhamomyces ciferrii]
MVYGKHIKVSCQVCIIGHRTKTCNHKSIIESDDPGYNGHRGCLEVISKKGRRKSRVPDRIDGVGNTKDDDIVTLNPNNDKFILIEAKLVPKLNEWCPNSQNSRYECCCKKKSKELYINEETSSFLRVPQYCDFTSIEDAKKIGTPVSYKDLPTDFLDKDVNFHSIAKLYPDKSDYPNQAGNINAQSTNNTSSQLAQNVQLNNNMILSELLNTNPIIPIFDAKFNYQIHSSEAAARLDSFLNGNTDQQDNNNQGTDQGTDQNIDQDINRIYNNLQFIYNQNLINNNHHYNLFNNIHLITCLLNSYENLIQNNIRRNNNDHSIINDNTNQNSDVLNHNNQRFVDVNTSDSPVHNNPLANDNEQGSSMSTNARPHQPSNQHQNDTRIGNQNQNHIRNTRQWEFVFEDPSNYPDF